MKFRVMVAMLLFGMCFAGGCRSDLFSDCDKRPSLADWFDCYGPTGCYCRNGRCPVGYCATCGNQCSHGKACSRCSAH